jgi:hypothetical protein
MGGLVMVFAPGNKRWYATVGLGANPAPHGPWESPVEAAGAIRRWLDRIGVDAEEATRRHVVRVHTYASRQPARDADIGDTLGKDSCVRTQSLYDFLFEHEEGP